MLLLVTDTSGKNGNVALARADEHGAAPEVIESGPLAGGTFSAQLVPQIAELLSKHGFRKGDIDAFVVVSGPGSFTGLRIGLAAIKGLAEILHKPIVPVGLLQVLAMGAGVEGRLVSALDAGRGELYVGEYESSGGSSGMVREQLLSRSEFVALAAEATVATSDEALAALCNGKARIVRVDAAAIARLGWAKLRAGQTVSSEQLEANYIRRTDAEIFAKPASGN
jgi:tRNA threonylcarbamoyladenosine biosynthesis protein TsaB